MNLAPFRGLYAVTPETDDADWLIRSVDQALDGGARAIQYRFKDTAPDEAVRIARDLGRPFSHERTCCGASACTTAA